MREPRGLVPLAAVAEAALDLRNVGCTRNPLPVVSVPHERCISLVDELGYLSHTEFQELRIIFDLSIDCAIYEIDSLVARHSFAMAFTFHLSRKLEFAGCVRSDVEFPANSPLR